MNAAHDNIPIEEINKRTPRPEWDWDQTEKEIATTQKRTKNQNKTFKVN